MASQIPESSLPEPWLRGILPDYDPVIAHLLRASQQIREDMGRALDGLDPADVWYSPHGVSPLGFHAKHIAGSTRRLSAYLAGFQLTEAQFAEMGNEGTGSETASELLDLIRLAMDEYDTLLRTLDPADFGAVREIGRKRMETTMVSVAIHIAEHSMRHVGLAIAASKLARVRSEEALEPGL